MSAAATKTHPNAANQYLENYISVVDSFINFLTVAIHLILYERDVYPKTSFMSVRKYNFPVQQSRHPDVCKWIDDAVAAVRSEMLKVSRLHGFTVPSRWFGFCAFAKREDDVGWMLHRWLGVIFKDASATDRQLARDFACASCINAVI